MEPRKNGKLASCEPCRRSKLACDHANPCARCTRLGRVAICIYDPAPAVTERDLKRRKLSSHSPDTANTSVVRFADQPERVPQGAASASESTIFSEPLDASQQVNLHRLSGNWSVTSRRQSVKFRPGFQGSTSFSAILNEYEPSLGQPPFDENTIPTARMEPDPAHLKLGAEILSLLPPQEISKRAMSMYPKVSVAVSMHLPTIKHFHDAFWAEYGDLLAEPRSMKRLLECSRRLSQRTTDTPLTAAFPSNKEYLDALTNRWELLGVLFTVLRFLDAAIPGAQELLRLIPQPRGKVQSFSHCMLECAEACLHMVDLLDTGLNLYVAYLSYRCSSLRGLITQSGDTNYTYWRRNVQLSGDMTALGFHRLPGLLPQQSLLHLEQQKRIFMSAFTCDKHMAIFLGRPPALSKRYVTTQPLLDASDEDLVTLDLLTIQSRLNEHGYNKAGELYRSTITRAFYQSSMIYEDILEINLGTSAVDFDRVRQVVRTLEDNIRHQPAKLHLTINRELFQNSCLVQAFGAVEIQLINLHQRFLLDRIEHGTEDLDFGKAEEMLRIVLTFWTEREQYQGHEDDIHWTICCYGIPASSAIAVGLWKAPTASAWRNSSRSETIQSLSLFIACLDWIKPDEGNYQLCQRTIRMLKSILDRILEPPPVEPLADFSSWDLSNFSLAGMPNFGIDMEDLLSSEWQNAPRATFC